MIKQLKSFILALLIVVLAYFLYVIISGLFIGGLLPLAPSPKKIELYFNENQQELANVAEALSQLKEYDYIAIRQTEGSNIMNTSSNIYMTNTDILIDSIQKDISISNVELISNIEKLYTHGFEAIFKYGNDYILFSRWSSLDSSRGIAYSFKNQKPEIEFAINLNPLSKNWYYYEIAQ